MKKNLFWIIIGITTLLISWLFYPENNPNRETYLVISSYLGRVVGILLFPALIALLFKGIAKIFKKEFSSRSFKTTFFIFWILLVLSALTNFLYDSGNILSQNTSQQNQAEQTNVVPYNPAGNEYTVYFDKEPEIKQNTFFNTELESETAELIQIDDASFVRAESFQYRNQLEQGQIDRELVRKMLEDFSRNNGFQYPEFRYKETELGKIGMLRGFKTLKDNSGNEIEATFSVQAYFGNSSGMILQGASPSSVYPTPKIVTFFDSIEKDR